MIGYIKTIITGAWSLAVGMWIALVNIFRRRVTMNYPYQKLQMTPRYRGHIELKCDPVTGEPKCIACMACQRACPSACIKLEGAKAEGAAKRSLTSYTLDFTTCSLCGLCVESCNFDALEFSKEYNLASLKKSDYQMDLLQRARDRKGS